MPHPELNRFEEIYRRAGEFLDKASKEDVAEAARILAITLAQYQARYGELPAGEYLSFAAMDKLTPALAKTLADDMEVLVDGVESFARQETSYDSLH